MNAYRYDKTFEGLLSTVFDAYTRKVFPDALLGLDEVPESFEVAEASGALCTFPLLSLGDLQVLPLGDLQACDRQADSYQVGSSPDKAGRVFTALRKKLSPEGVQRLLAAWLAEEPGGDMRIFRFIRRVLDCPALLESDCGDPDVFALGQMARRVNRERHRLMGFVRFQKTAQGVYFASIAPRHNVLPLLLNHFTRRLADQPWIIYDTGRRYGMYYDLCGVQEVWLNREGEPVGQGGQVKQGEAGQGEPAGQIEPFAPLTSEGRLAESLLAEGEALVQDMWKDYFKAAAIKERANPKLQRQFMPRRYWPYLTEFFA